MRTLSATPPATGEGPDDLDLRVVDQLEALRQRVVQRLRFRAGTWALDTRRGTDSVLGHGITPELAGAIISRAIRDEGGDEVTDVTDVVVGLDHDTRVATYQARVSSIYGEMRLSGSAV